MKYSICFLQIIVVLIYDTFFRPTSFCSKLQKHTHDPKPNMESVCFFSCFSLVWKKKNRQKKRTDSNNQPLFLLQTGLQSDGVKLSISFSFPKTSLKKKNPLQFQQPPTSNKHSGSNRRFLWDLEIQKPWKQTFLVRPPCVEFSSTRGKKTHVGSGRGPYTTSTLTCSNRTQQSGVRGTELQ